MTNQRKLWRNEPKIGYTQLSQEQDRKNRLLKSSREKEGEFLPRVDYRDNFTKTGCKKNKLDTGEDRTRQRMRRSQKIKTYCWN